MTPARPSRRHLLRHALALGTMAPLARRAALAAEDVAPLPLVDYHVHLDNSSITQVAPLAAERGVKFGIVEHAGTKENIYPVVLSNDAELIAFADSLDGPNVFKGVQAEWIDWAGCFSKAALKRLDYVLTDTMTFPGRDGRRVKLWEPDAADRVDMANPDRFMERFVDWHIEILTTQPIDLLANVSWLPAPLAADYDRHWTDARIRRVVETAVKQGIALEISASYKLPNLRFLRLAKAAGARFSFGSNGRYPKMGQLDYSLEMARALSLTPADLFTPPPGGCKASRDNA
jgi:histidinol phosphatase-like PHP family hydrolase